MVPIIEDKVDSKLGEGAVHAKLVGAFGHVGPNVVSGRSNDVFPITGYSAIAGDSSTLDQGISTNSLSGNGVRSGVNLQPNLYVERMYYQQHLKSGIPFLTDFLPGMNILPESPDWETTADFYTGVVRWRDLFATSRYYGNELTQFQNTGFVVNPAILVSINAPSVAYQIHQGLGKNLGAELTSAVMSPNASDALGPWTLTYQGKLNWQTAFLGPHWTKPGSLYVGGYDAFFNGSSTLPATNPILGTITNQAGNSFLSGTAGPRDTVLGVYAGLEQELYKGISAWGSFAANNVNPNNALLLAFSNGTGVNGGIFTIARAIGAQYAFTSGLNIPVATLLPGWTSKDEIGLAYAYINGTELGSQGNPANFRRAAEQDTEFFYRWQISDRMSIVPSLQLIFNRFNLDKNGTDVVMGVRTSYSF